MIIFDIDWPKLISRVLKLITKGFIKLEEGKQKVRDLMKYLPSGKVGDVYEDPTHAKTPGGMVEHSLDPMKLDPSRDLPSRTIHDIFDEEVKKEVKKAGKEVVEIIKDEVDKAKEAQADGPPPDPMKTLNDWFGTIKDMADKAAQNAADVAKQKAEEDKSSDNTDKT